MTDSNLPPCGLYKTSQSIAGIPEDRLVYFHNHGDPGPGLYMPQQWIKNKAFFSQKGHVLDDVSQIDDALVPLPAEGFYTTQQRLDFGEGYFVESGVLVQIGYNGGAEPILFIPTWNEVGLDLPETGRKVSATIFKDLSLVKVRHNMQLQDATVH